MNSIKIEKIAILELRRLITLHQLMNDFIDENDKEPSWDGSIYIYNNSNLKVENILHKVPVQVKGKNNELLLNKDTITYPIKYKHLKNYYRDGGVCYFVIVISDDATNTSIYCNALTPIKLQYYLNSKNEISNDSTKNIPLNLIKNKDDLYKVLIQFGDDSQKQGSGNGEIIRNAISLENFNKIDSIKMKIYGTDDKFELLKKVSTGEVCIYGHHSSLDIWLPFEYKQQLNTSISHIVTISNSLGFQGFNCYSKYKVELINKENYIIHLSDNLKLDIKNNKIEFKAISSLNDIYIDIKFLNSLQEFDKIYINENPVLSYNNLDFPSELYSDLNYLSVMISAFEHFNIDCNKKVCEFTDKDWSAIDELIKIFRGNIDFKDKYMIYMWWWQGRVIPILLIKNSLNKADSYNLITVKDFIIEVHNNDNKYKVPNFVMFKRDIWINLYNVKEDILIDEIKKSDFNIFTQDILSLLFVEILSAYDTIKEEKYYNTAKLISDKLLEVDSLNEYWNINNFQLIKRKRALTELELEQIERIQEKSCDDMVICATNILLENTRNAKKCISSLPDEEYKLFIDYPIYNLL